MSAKPLLPTVLLLVSPVAHGEAQAMDCSVCAELVLTSDYRRFGPSSAAGEPALQDATVYNAELTYVSCDEDVPGPTCDFLQGRLLARRYVGDSWLAASVAYTPRGALAGGRQADTCSKRNMPCRAARG